MKEPRKYSLNYELKDFCISRYKNPSYKLEYLSEEAQEFIRSDKKIYWYWSDKSLNPFHLFSGLVLDLALQMKDAKTIYNVWLYTSKEEAEFNLEKYKGISEGTYWGLGDYIPLQKPVEIKSKKDCIDIVNKVGFRYVTDYVQHKSKEDFLYHYPNFWGCFIESDHDNFPQCLPIQWDNDSYAREIAVKLFLEEDDCIKYTEGRIKNYQKYHME